MEEQNPMPHGSTAVLQGSVSNLFQPKSFAYDSKLHRLGLCEPSFFCDGLQGLMRFGLLDPFDELQVLNLPTSAIEIPEVSDALQGQSTSIDQT